MKDRLKVIKKKLKKIYRELKVDKNKYYWKRKYYKLLKQVKEQQNRNDTLSEDLRRMYCQKNNSKHYWYRFCILLNMIAKKEGINEQWS